MCKFNNQNINECGCWQKKVSQNMKKQQRAGLNSIVDSMNGSSCEQKQVKKQQQERGEKMDGGISDRPTDGLSLDWQCTAYGTCQY